MDNQKKKKKHMVYFCCSMTQNNPSSDFFVRTTKSKIRADVKSISMQFRSQTTSLE